LAGDNHVLNEKVYYIAVRYGGLEDRAVQVAAEAALVTRPDAAALVQPFVEMESVPLEQKAPRIAEGVDGLLHAIERARSADDSGGKEAIVAALHYARDMVHGDFVQAYETWQSMSETRRALAVLDDVAASYPASSLSPRLGRGARLAVVMPGPASSNDLDAIRQHDLIGAMWHHSGGKDPEGPLTHPDLVFLNQSRFAKLIETGEGAGEAALVVKSHLAKWHGRLDSSIRHRVHYELVPPRSSAAASTYFAVVLALWAMASFDIPATFYRGDFYLGDRAYQKEGYHGSGLLDTVNTTRLSYLSHDVFYVHRALSHWLVTGKIKAHGRLESLLRMSGLEFARCMEERWGSAALS
jgi:hypothetical protein